MGLGPFDPTNPEASLESARRRAADLRDTIARGEDPMVKRGEEREKVANALKLSERPTFLEYATRYVRTAEAGWKNPVHRQQWMNTLGIGGAGKRRMHYCDSLHGLKIDKIDTAAIRRVLDPIWTTKVETARRLRGRLERILDAAKAEHLREGDNPAEWKRLRALGYQPKGKLREVAHHASMDWKAVPGFMARLREKQGTAPRCVEMLVLTAGRSVEVREARWSEIDWQTKRWIIPGGLKGRMKMAREHAVPMSEPVTELLRRMERFKTGEFIFPGMKPGAALTDTSLRNVLRDLGITKDDASIHGFRASFRTWSGEATSYPRDAAEHALAHSLPALDAAYFRGTMWEKRVEMMADWAKLCGSVKVKLKKPAKAKARVVPVKPNREGMSAFLAKAA
jgi:integrase